MQGRKWREQEEEEDVNSEQDESKQATFTGRSTLYESSSESTTDRSDRLGDQHGGGESVNVVIRVRPISNQETQRKDKSILTFPGNGAIVVEQSAAAAKSFAYNVVFEPSSSQEDVFEYSGIKKLVDMAINGYSCTAFAFGQTGSGKTYTMTGPPEQNANTFLTSEVKGLIPRSFYYLFDQLAKRPNLGCRLTASYLEIYNEQVRDLLNPNPKTHLAVRWSSHKGFYVENLFVVECETIDDLTAVLEEGIRNRVMGSNSVNEHSSRSHSMLTLHIDSEMQDMDDDNLFITKRGKLTFVDLAGSERTKSDGAIKQGHLQESNNINRSLLVLGNCISALGDLKKKQGHVPYRDSKLTKLLSDSLRGNGVTLMIACVSPSSFNSNETMNTLRYASRARHIKAKPIIIMDPREKFILSLKREIKILRQENHYLRHQLDFPVKPKGQLQKENDTKFMQMLRDQRRDGRTTEHGLYEMLQEYMIENEMLRDENSELHQVREIGRREQQMLSRENEKLMKKMETAPKNGVVVSNPVLYGERSYGLDSISSTPMQSPAGPRTSMAATWKQVSGGKRGFPSQPKKPPHHLTEPVARPANLGPSPTHQRATTKASNRRSLDSLTATEFQEEMATDDSWQGTGTARIPDVKHGTPRRIIDNGHLNDPHEGQGAVSSRKYPTESQAQLNARLRRELVNLENEIKRSIQDSHRTETSSSKDDIALFLVTDTL